MRNPKVYYFVINNLWAKFKPLGRLLFMLWVVIIMFIVIVGFKRPSALITYDGMFQGNSLVQWSLFVQWAAKEPKMPGSMNFEAKVIGKTLRFKGGGMPVSIALFSTRKTVQNWGITKSQTYSSPAIVAQELKFNSNLPMTFSILVGNIGSLTYISEIESILKVGYYESPFDPFKGIFSELVGFRNQDIYLHANTLPKQLIGKFGNPPAYEYPMVPPKYSKNNDIIYISLDGGNEVSFDTLGALRVIEAPGFYVSASDEPSVQLDNLPVETIVLYNLARANLRVAGIPQPLLEPSMLKIDFDPYAHLSIDSKRKTLSLNGRARILRIDGKNSLKYSINNWEWYKQAIAWGLLVGIPSILFGDRLRRVLIRIYKET